jgi:hypothetical protein
MRVTRAYVPAIFVLATAGLAVLAGAPVFGSVSPNDGWPFTFIGLAFVMVAFGFSAVGVTRFGVGRMAANERLVWLLGSALFVVGLLAAMRVPGSSQAWYAVAFAGTYVQIIAQLMQLDRAGVQ